VAVPIGLVHREPAVADADRAHDPHAQDTVHSERRLAAGAARHRSGHGDRNFLSVLSAGSERGHAAAALELFRLALRHAAELLRADPNHQDDLHPQIWKMAVTMAAPRARLNKPRWTMPRGRPCQIRLR